MSRGRKRAHEEEEHENHERWLVSYADMMTLLMVLFVVLFAISSVNTDKFKALHDGLARSLGETKVLDGSEGVLQGATRQAITPDQSLEAQEALRRQQAAAAKAKLEAEAMDKVQAAITKALAVKHLERTVEFRRDARGLVINIVTDSVLFDVGSAELRPGGRTVLDAVAPALAKLPNALTVEGHTDNVPISGRYPTNWELSAERSTTVLRFLLTRHVKSSVVSAAGYADQRPLVPNDTVAHRARNRRVAIVVLSSLTTDPAAGQTSSDALPASSTGTPAATTPGE
jgi:chemotaxis protein MotB